MEIELQIECSGMCWNVTCLGVGQSTLDCMIPAKMKSLTITPTRDSPDEKIEDKDKEENRKDPPGVDIDLLDLGEAVACRLLLRHRDGLVDVVTQPLLLVLITDHRHRAVLADATPSLKITILVHYHFI